MSAIIIIVLKVILTMAPFVIKMFVKGREKKLKMLREVEAMINEKIKQTKTIMDERRDIKRQKDWFKKRDEENEKLIKGIKKDTE